jgi:two-component system, cell cycle response regulator
VAPEYDEDRPGYNTVATVAVPSMPESGAGVVGATLTVLTGGEAGRLLVMGPDGGVMGRGQAPDYGFPESSISRRHARIALRDGRFELTDLESLNGTFVDGTRLLGSMLLPPNCRIQLGNSTILQFAVVDELSAEAVQTLSTTISTDPLTGCGNRFQLQQRLDQEVHFARRHGDSLAMLLLDLDHFKNVNDTHGHPTGDKVLEKAGAILVDSVRTEDAVFRYGGEEFCILIRQTNPAGLAILAERIRYLVQQAEVEGPDGPVKVTISIGVAGLVEGDDEGGEGLLMRADQALYRAKEGGRNQVVLDDSC